MLSKLTMPVVRSTSVAAKRSRASGAETTELEATTTSRSVATTSSSSAAQRSRTLSEPCGQFVFSTFHSRYSTEWPFFTTQLNLSSRFSSENHYSIETE